MISELSPRYLKAGATLAAVVLLGIVAFAVRTVGSFRATSDSVLHTQEVRLQLGEMFSRLKDIQLNTRSYLMAGDERALQARDQARSEFSELVTELRRLTADNPNQQLAISRLDKLVEQLMAEFDVYVSLRRSGGMPAVMARVANGEAKRLGEEIRTVGTGMQTEESRLLELRLARARREGALTNAVLIGGLVLVALLIGAIVVVLQRNFRAREVAAAALRKQAEEIKDLYNQAPCGYHSLDAEGRVTAVNDTQLAWLGYRRDQQSSPTRFADSLTPSSRPVFEHAFGRLSTGGELRDLELELIRSDGSTLPCLLNASAIRDRTGRLIATRSTLFDLTERQRVEQLVEQSRAYFESIVDTVHESLVILTSDLRVNSTNRVFCETFALQAAEIVGRPFIELNNGVWNIPELMAALSAVIPEHREVKDFEVHREFPRLGSKIMLLNARKLYRLGNNTTLLLLAIEDITVRKRIEASLERERYLLGELMDNVPELIYFKDRASRFLRINRGLGSRFGLKDPADAVGKTDFDYYAEEHARPAYEDEQEVMRTGQEMTKEEKETWPDGHVTWVQTVKLPLRDENRAIVGTFGLSHDVTDRKKSEERLQNLNASLEQHSIELEAANQELEAFSYSVSHDLRAPLRHIDYFSAMLQKNLPSEQLDAKSRRYLTTISESARGMGQLIDDLLAFAKIGRVPLQRSRVRLGRLVEEVRGNLQGEVNGRIVEWKLEPLPEVEGDPSLLRQVLANLLGNAVKYTRNRPEAKIHVGTQPGEPGEVVVFIRDNGAGFDMSYAEKLFGVFQRLHSSEEFEGTGVGLANVRRIVQRHGGKTWAEGAVDAGATFYFSLPATVHVAHPS